MPIRTAGTKLILLPLAGLILVTMSMMREVRAPHDDGSCCTTDFALEFGHIQFWVFFVMGLAAFAWWLYVIVQDMRRKDGT
jgi:hypothetical protein